MLKFGERVNRIFMDRDAVMGEHMWHVTVSGPKSSSAQAKTALGRFDFLHYLDLGLPEYASETTKKKQPQGFLTVQATDVDEVVKAVAPLGWALRMHGPPPESLPGNREHALLATLADMRREIDELKAKVNR